MINCLFSPLHGIVSISCGFLFFCLLWFLSLSFGCFPQIFGHPWAGGLRLGVSYDKAEGSFFRGFGLFTEGLLVWCLRDPWVWVPLFYSRALVDELQSRVQLFATLWTVAHQGPPSMGFSRQEYCSGLPCSSSADVNVFIYNKKDYSSTLKTKLRLLSIELL